MTRNCSDVRGLLGGYVRGDIVALERAFVEAHLARCPSCTAVKEAIDDGVRAARQELAVDTDHLVALVRAASTAPAPRARRRWPVMTAVGAALAASVAVVVTLQESPQGGAARLAAVDARAPSPSGAVDVAAASAGSGSGSMPIPMPMPMPMRSPVDVPMPMRSPVDVPMPVPVPVPTPTPTPKPMPLPLRSPWDVPANAVTLEDATGPWAPSASPAVVAKRVRRRTARPTVAAVPVARETSMGLEQKSVDLSLAAVVVEGTLDELIPLLDEAARLGRSGDGDEALARYHALERDARFAKHTDLIAYERARLQGLVLGDVDTAKRELARLAREGSGHVADEAAVTRCEVERTLDPCGALACLDAVAASGRGAASDAKRLRARWSSACASP